MAEKPSLILGWVLSGQIPIEEAPGPIRSWARFYIYQGACEVLLIETTEGRRAALDKIPPMIRPHIEREAKRLWAQRRGH